MKPSFVFVTDNPNSWSLRATDDLIVALREAEYSAQLVHKVSDAPPADVAVYLSCERIVPAQERARFAHNLVVHASDLPRGRGWSPLSWQILDGATSIVVTLFEAVEAVDAGPVYARRKIELGGHELIDELRAAIDGATRELILEFARRWPAVQSEPQSGEPTFYPRRRPIDSKIDTDRPLREIFNHLRIVDNERYPAYFEHAGHIYELRISKRGPVR